MNKYDSIINLEHWNPTNHERMSMYDRASQFGAFKALTGYEDLVIESGRYVLDKIKISNDDKLNINSKLNLIKNNLKNNQVIIEYFIKDKYKEGGMYIKIQTCIIKINEVDGYLEILENKKITFDNIINLDIIDI